MKRITIIMIVLVGSASALLICARTQTPGRSSQASRPESQAAKQIAFERAITTQQRLNRYFHGDVIPKLKNCWSSIKGKGTIALKYTYTKDGTGKWIFNKLEVNQSTLPKGQDAAALKCMQDSVRGTSFPVEGNDASEKAFVLNWTWPVPFPRDADEQTRVMFAAKGKGGLGENGGGCDGNGAAAACKSCGFLEGLGLVCYTVCVGYKTCSAALGSNVCTESGACASGGPFGTGGGKIFAQ